MKTYYSIVSIATNPILNEQFNIGLLCVTPLEAYFHFSKDKFKVIRSLLSDSGAKLALSALKGIEQTVNTTGVEENLRSREKQAFSEAYLNYLSRYNNNLIQFTPPVEIDLNVDESLFQTLFQKFVFSEESFESVENARNPLFGKQKRAFKNKARAYANIDFSVGKDLVKNLVVPVKVDVFGKNGAFVSGQTIDFSKTAASLNNALSSYLYLVDHAKQSDNGASCYILGSEPDKASKEQHEIWTSIRQSRSVEFVDMNDAELVIEAMKRKGVKPIL
jgi:hypothetical protein